MYWLGQIRSIQVYCKTMHILTISGKQVHIHVASTPFVDNLCGQREELLQLCWISRRSIMVDLSPVYLFVCMRVLLVDRFYHGAVSEEYDLPRHIIQHWRWKFLCYSSTIIHRPIRLGVGVQTVSRCNVDVDELRKADQNNRYSFNSLLSSSFMLYCNSFGWQ